MGIFDFVKLLDFGLVKASDSERQSKLTSAGSFTGTPLYLSPEAVQNPDEVDARSDLYAVGAVGYWLLTGTTVDGRRVRVRGCDHWEFRSGKVIRKDSYWKIVE